MSETVRYRGQLIKITYFDDQKLEERCRRLLEQENPSFELDNFYDSYQEYLTREYNDKYYIYNKDIYRIKAAKFDADQDIFEGVKDEYGNINFHTIFYNGGCDLSEALDEVIKNIK